MYTFIYLSLYLDLEIDIYAKCASHCKQLTISSVQLLSLFVRCVNKKQKKKIKKKKSMTTTFYQGSTRNDPEPGPRPKSRSEKKKRVGEKTWPPRPPG